MRIDVYLRDDRKPWADFHNENSNAKGNLLEHYVGNTEEEISKIISNPGIRCPERVKALAERGLKELKQAQVPAEVKTYMNVPKRGFFGRLKYAFTGK